MNRHGSRSRDMSLKKYERWHTGGTTYVNVVYLPPSLRCRRYGRL